MQDFDAPSSKRVLAELAKEGAWENLMKLAGWWTKSEAEAEDLVADALGRVLDPDDMPWDPDRSGFFGYVGTVIRHVWGRHVRKARVQREVIDTGIAHDESVTHLEPMADDVLNEHRAVALRRFLAERVLDAIRDKHPRAVQVYELGARGIDEPSEQARMIGCPVEDVYVAMNTLRRFARAAYAEWEEQEERRMADLRENVTLRKKVKP